MGFPCQTATTRIKLTVKIMVIARGVAGYRSRNRLPHPLARGAVEEDPRHPPIIASMTIVDRGVRARTSVKAVPGLPTRTRIEIGLLGLDLQHHPLSDLLPPGRSELGLNAGFHRYRARNWITSHRPLRLRRTIHRRGRRITCLACTDMAMGWAREIRRADRDYLY
jgi:hypothetical protein